MLAKQVTRFYCEICGSEHMSPEAAACCERLTVRRCGWPVKKGDHVQLAPRMVKWANSVNAGVFGYAGTVTRVFYKVHRPPLAARFHIEMLEIESFEDGLLFEEQSAFFSKIE